MMNERDDDERMVDRCIWEYLLRPFSNPELMAGVMTEYEKKIDEIKERQND